jgi:hypothetical protein
MGEDALQAAIAEAVAEVGTDKISSEPVALEGEADGVSAYVASTVKSSAPEGETPSKVEPAAAPVVSEELSTLTETDVPLEAWGLDLTGIPAEKRAEIIAHIEGQEGYVHKLQERLAAVPAAAAPVVENEEVSDEALLDALGIDPETTDPAVVKTLLTLGRTQLELEGQLESVKTVQDGREAETAWNRELDNLEATYGKMPGLKDATASESRAAQLRLAMSENIASPYELYFKLTAPIKQEASTAASAARRAAAQQDAGGALRPSTSGAKTPGITKGMTLREATAVAMAEAEQETKFSWKRALGR